MTRTTALFDIDGTLVDSNYLHVEAWSRAFEEIGMAAEGWRVHRSIGMDSEKLLDVLIPEANAHQRDRATELHAQHYRPLMHRLRPFDGGRELLQELHRRGTTVVLATSAPERELHVLREVLGVNDSIDVVTSAEDVGAAKPAPDIVETALTRAGASPAEAVMVGDTVWDVEASGRAGVSCIGLRSGGISEIELRGAGAAAVYDNIRALLEQLPASLLAD